MSDHSKALVPLESWSYSAPELRAVGRQVDLGLFAEALIYYDCVIANITNQPQLAEFLRWFVTDQRLDDLLSLVRDGVVKLYDYSFATAAVQNQEGDYSIWNMQDPIQMEPNTFERRFLYHPDVEAVIPKGRHRQRLYEALRGNVIEAKASAFGPAVENARRDYCDPRRGALIVQAFVDELWRIRGLDHPPRVEASVHASADGSKQRITWNISFAELAQLGGDKLGFHPGATLTAAGISNRVLWSAAEMGCDLYLAQPLGMLVGDKLYESTEKVAKAGGLIEELKAKVEFPDVRALVNDGKLGLADVLRIRKKAQRFRTWLQQEPERDRDALIAYHNEVARELGIVTAARKALSIFGAIGGGAAGALLGTAVAGPAGAALGGGAGSAIGYLADVVAKLGADWKPVVFGNWLRARIEKLVKDEFSE